MTEAGLQLWNRLQAFQLDDPNAAFTFSHRLAAENGWNRAYTLRVMEEYKRFLFLCCISATPVTPSDAVDQAWHLHLVYTRSYWDDLCKNVLQRELHHGPTKGGEVEAEKFDGMYTLLKDIYYHTFSEQPPADIWLTNEERFQKNRFQRINRKDYWLIKKARLSKETFQVMLVGLIIIGIFVKADDSSAFFVGIGLVFLVIVLLRTLNKQDDGNGSNGGSGCGGGCVGISADGCGSSHGHDGCGGHGDGCSSGGDGGSSGCSGGGCSGCGGGCGGD